MYLEPTIQRKKKRRSSPLRVMILLLLIAAALYVYTMLQQDEVERPYVSAPTPTRSAFSYVLEAEGLYARGQLTQTIAAYERAIALEPGDVRPYIPLARLLTIAGRVGAGIQRARQATALAPENAAAWAVLGMAYDWNGEVEEAIAACKRAIELDPAYAEGHAYLAEAYTDAGRWFDAHQAIETALQLNERSVDAHRNHGYLLELQGNYAAATAAYERALEIQPNLGYIHIAVGRNYRRMGDLDTAIERFERAIAINPGDPLAQFELGWTYLTYYGDYERAEAHLQRAIEADPQFGRAYGALGIVYWQRRNYEDAIPAFEQAIRWSSCAARQRAAAFLITVEDINSVGNAPSSEVVMRGEFLPAALDDLRDLRAMLTPERAAGEAWASASGTVTFDTVSGVYTVTLVGLPKPAQGQAYVGWIEGVQMLAGGPVNTSLLQRKSDGSVRMRLEARSVRGPAIEYFYTLGLAYYYKDECDKARPLFEAALQIDPTEANALEGLRLCR